MPLVFLILALIWGAKWFLEKYWFPLERMLEELELVRTVNSSLRIQSQGSTQLKALSAKLNQMASNTELTQQEIKKNIEQATRSLEEEKHLFEALLEHLPTAETAKRLIAARILLVVLGAAGAFVASLKLTSILGAVAWAFDFAMSGLFFPLVLGVWWKRANRQGAVAGMLLGFLSGTWYLYMVRWGGMEPWLGIDHLRFGIIGCAVNLVTMIVVSLATEEPDEATQKMVDEVRIPKGETVLAASH